MYHIIDNIYLSNLRDAEDIALINTNDIKVVCRLSDDHNESIYGSLVEFHNFECEDNIMAGDEMIEAADKIYHIVSQTKDHVLIHCNEGQSRSVSVIIYYMIRKYGTSFDRALAHIKNIKHDVRPNSVFERRLRHLSIK